MVGDAALPVPDPLARSARPTPDEPSFAHASEAELARILDFYQVAWEYEPHVFPILWNLDGVVIESFSPDFYLPDFDAYVELTTLRQPLVRKKNRKLRRLRELYPDIGIKLLYARDFRALMVKYGKFGLVDALSGTSGQVLPASAGRAGVAADDTGDAGRRSSAPEAFDAAGNLAPAEGHPAPTSTDAPATLVARSLSPSALRRARRRRRSAAAELHLRPRSEA
jgi:hypoxanthine phosphoribosyltransferase